MSEGTKRKKQNRLTGKDLINVGIYSALYLVIVMIFAFMGFIPVMMPMICVLAPIFGGIPFMLYITKVKKFGMILIMSIIMGIVMSLTGMGLYALPVGIITALIAELIWKRAEYSKASGAVFTYAFFSIWMWGNFIPLFTNPEAYFSTRQNFGADYEAALTALLPPWMAPALLAACFICGIIGALAGRALLKKHFSKAGIV